MGEEHEAAQRRAVFAPYQVNESLMAVAQPDALFMHCLPAHRGEEVTSEVIESPQSVVFDQAENRLHTQKALLLMLLGTEQRICKFQPAIGALIRSGAIRQLDPIDQMGSNASGAFDQSMLKLQIEI